MSTSQRLRRAALRPGLASLLALALAACGSSDTKLAGKGYQPPSDVTQLQTVPLTVPPDFSARPQAKTNGKSNQPTVVEAAPKTINVADMGLTPGEQVLLKRAGVPQSDPTIRKTLNRENAIFAGDPSFVDKLMFGDFPSGAVNQASKGPQVSQDVEIQQKPPDQGSWLDAITNFF